MTAPKKTEKSLSTFKSIYDPNVRVPAAIRAAFESMLKEHGPEAWDYEKELSQRAGLNTNQVAAFREQFEKHVIVVRESGRSEKRVWFADSRIAAKARGNG